MQEITYRALPYDRDFETRHEAVGFAAIKRPNPDSPFPVVQWMDEDRRDMDDRLNKVVNTVIP